MNVAGIILAAGRSSRMGRDKALLEFEGSTFLESLARTFSAEVHPIVVVLGHHAEAIQRAVRSADVRFVVNHDYDKGMLSSLQIGLRALPSEAEGVIFTLVDHPGGARDTVRRIRQALESSGAPVVIPRYRGKRGHPVGIDRTIISELLELSPEASPQDVIRSHRSETEFLDLDDPAIVRDVDRPEDYEKLKGE